MVEHVSELIESLLLQPQRRRRRIRSIRFEGPVHSLVTSILLWPPWLDALMHDSHLHPSQR